MAFIIKSQLPHLPVEHENTVEDSVITAYQMSGNFKTSFSVFEISIDDDYISIACVTALC